MAPTQGKGATGPREYTEQVEVLISTPPMDTSSDVDKLRQKKGVKQFIKPQLVLPKPNKASTSGPGTKTPPLSSSFAPS